MLLHFCVHVVVEEMDGFEKAIIEPPKEAHMTDTLHSYFRFIGILLLSGESHCIVDDLASHVR